MPWWKRLETVLLLLVVLPILLSVVALYFSSLPPFDPRTVPVKPTVSTAARSCSDCPCDCTGSAPIRVDVSQPGAAVRAAGSIIEDLIRTLGAPAQDVARIGPKIADSFLTALAEATGKKVPEAAEGFIRWLMSRNVVDRRRAFREHVLFTPDRSVLSQSAYGAVNRVRAFADEHKDTLILIRAFADSTHSTPHNRSLARQRADAIRDALTARGGLALSRVFISEIGEEELVEITADRTQEPRNRAAEIFVY